MKDLYLYKITFENVPEICYVIISDYNTIFEKYDESKICNIEKLDNVIFDKTIYDINNRKEYTAYEVICNDYSKIVITLFAKNIPKMLNEKNPFNILFIQKLDNVKYILSQLEMDQNIENMRIG